MVYRIFVERRPGFDIEAAGILADLRGNLGITGLYAVRMINRYDVEGIDAEVFARARLTVFSEPQTDTASDTFDAGDSTVFASEYLPGQFDQRADSCEQCIQILSGGIRPRVRTAKIYLLGGNLTESDTEKIKRYMINPVECREASLDTVVTLATDYAPPPDVATLHGFTAAQEDELVGFLGGYSPAMDGDDLAFCRSYFRDQEQRDPTMTEIRLIDSYWSDHCRHTTFLTRIDKVYTDDPLIEKAYAGYLSCREELYGADTARPITLMDMATVGAKYLRRHGYLDDLDISEEINACSVRIKAKINGGEEDWLLLFKNETHNHPTEIEPFGGAATCLGGAIRDPLSGRAYVYQAMRVTGAADPTLPVSQTLRGKLPQSKLTLGAASGYSSYGNQIGLATGGVYELYHPGYVAKRMEIGAVVGAVPLANIRREEPCDGDLVVLLGGRTGRDGCGGATGSSKAHNSESLGTCGAEVQKGNPPEERKLQRLFRNPEVALMIKRCNDFGAGGVSVAVGELADGLEIDLSAVPKKYEGLDGTELAISESQERMAVVIEPSCLDAFSAAAASENLEATVIARVTAEPRLKMLWRGKTVVDLSREFLNSNGAPKHTDISMTDTRRDDLFAPTAAGVSAKTPDGFYRQLLSDLNVCSRQGLSERFDASIGAGTVVMPFGGKYQQTPPQYMAAKLPVTEGDTSTVSVMAYGFNPYLSERNPFVGSAAAVIESVSRIVASGMSADKVRLTFQEYFGKTGTSPRRWGYPAEALLGALEAQLGLHTPAIGGKDSMSGSFEDLDVPPTLVSFAITSGEVGSVITPEFKAPGDSVWLLTAPARGESGFDYNALREQFTKVTALAATGKVRALYTPGFGGIAEGIFKMCIGNRIGFEYAIGFDPIRLTELSFGGFIAELDGNTVPEGFPDATLLGHTCADPTLTLGGESLDLDGLNTIYRAPLEGVFPMNTDDRGVVEPITCDRRPAHSHTSASPTRPRVLIPVFPGTNCEYDSSRAFREAGADTVILVLRNLTPQMLAESIEALCASLSKSQILMLPGGFSGGDEPDGSGKFITAVLRNPRVRDAVTDLTDRRDGLILGICNGFQALIKSGLLPDGHIESELSPDSPTLTFNRIARHQSRMVTTRVASVRSPWMSGFKVGDLHTIPVSHGEGRFIASRERLDRLIADGCVATQYTDPDGIPSMDVLYNPNGSTLAIEGIFSPDGRIFGKMGHSERAGNGVAVNIGGNPQKSIFRSGVEYFM